MIAFLHEVRKKIGGIRLLGTSLLLGACGCASFWDEVTSRNRDVTFIFSRQDPLLVLRDSSDGARRGQALGQLTEPADQEKHELYLRLLVAAATEDREPLCRLGAVRALATYKDPRAAKALEDVYLQRLPFTADLSTIIRQQALASLEKTGNPESRHLLIRVARQPSGGTDSSLTDRQQTQDERLTAVRGLARYKQYDSIETLVYLLETEKDVALRARAHHSLQVATGKNLPADAKTWRGLMENPEQPAQQKETLMDLVTWWKK